MAAAPTISIEQSDDTVVGLGVRVGSGTWRWQWTWSTAGATRTW